MNEQHIKKIIEAKKAELEELNREYAYSMKQFMTKRSALESQIQAFESQLKKIH